MKMILIPVPDSAEITDDMIGELTSALKSFTDALEKDRQLS